MSSKTNPIDWLISPAKSLMSRRARLVVLLVFVLLLVFLGGKVTVRRTQKPQYQTATAEKGTLVTYVSASGSISTGNNAVITTSATGLVKEVYVKKGECVTQGQKIVEISLDQDSAQKAAQAWSSYLSAKNSVASANQNKLSIQQSLEQDKISLLTAQTNAIGTDDWDPTSPSKQKIDLARRVAELALQIDQQKLTLADSQIAKAASDLFSAWLSYQAVSGNIVAPTAGVISNLSVAPGSLVSPSSSSASSNSSTSQKLGTITIPQGNIQAVVNLSEVDAPKVIPDQKVTLILDAFGGKTFTGQVLIVDTSGQVSSGVTTYPVTIALDTNAENIYPNMSVTAKIIIRVKDGVILIPAAAVQTNGDQSTVRVLKNGQLTPVPVEIGDSNDTQMEIVSGVTEGETVVTNVVNSTGNRTSGGPSPFGNFGGRGFGGGAVIRRPD